MKLLLLFIALAPVAEVQATTTDEEEWKSEDGQSYVEEFEGDTAFDLSNSGKDTTVNNEAMPGSFANEVGVSSGSGMANNGAENVPLREGRSGPRRPRGFQQPAAAEPTAEPTQSYVGGRECTDIVAVNNPFGFAPEDWCRDHECHYQGGTNCSEAPEEEAPTVDNVLDQIQEAASADSSSGSFYQDEGCAFSARFSMTAPTGLGCPAETAAPSEERNDDGSFKKAGVACAYCLTDVLKAKFYYGSFYDSATCFWTNAASPLLMKEKNARGRVVPPAEDGAFAWAVGMHEVPGYARCLPKSGKLYTDNLGQDITANTTATAPAAYQGQKKMDRSEFQ